MQYNLVSPEHFQEPFSVDAFLVQLTKDAINEKANPRAFGEGPAVVTSAKASLERVQKLLRVLDR